MITDIRSSLKSANLMVENDSIYDKCASLCEKYSSSAKEIVGVLEAQIINSNKGIISLDIMGKVEQQLLQNTQQRKKAKYTESSPSSDANFAKRSLTFSTPDLGKGSQSQMISGSNYLSNGLGCQSAVSDFASREDIGKVLLVFNESLETRGVFEPSSLKPKGFRCRVQMLTDSDESAPFNNVKGRYRYMYTMIEERAVNLDSHLFQLQKDMCKHAFIDETNDLQPVGVPSQESVWVCGRICNEATEGRLNSTSVVLEGSRKASGGRRLFPGQIVLVEGVGSSGREFVAKRIIEGVPRPLPMTAPSKLLEIHHNNAQFQSSQPLKVFVASGPFTTSANLSYEPLNALLRKILKSKPDLVILTGPFVDISQPLLEAGDIILDTEDAHGEKIGTHSASYEMVFIEKISRDGLLAVFNSEMNLPTQFVLVPSLLDAHHEYVYPQPPFADRELLKNDYFDDIGGLHIPFSKDENGYPKQVHLMPNPCMFRLNEVVFGITSNDALFGLSSDEASQGLAGSQRLTRLAGHILQQQSFNPQYPLPSSVQSQIDFRQSKHWEMQTSPDVLIIPSKLTHMVKEVFGTLVVNPGYLAKGSSGGTYAEMDIHPMKEDAIRDAVIAGKTSMTHDVASRTRVSILKI